jgi:hypothetical protein
MTHIVTCMAACNSVSEARLLPSHTLRIQINDSTMELHYHPSVNGESWSAQSFASLLSRSRIMFLTKLPIELVQHTINLAISGEPHSEQSKTLTALVSVNKALESEVSALCLRNVQDAMHGPGWWPRVPFLARFRMAREIITMQPTSGGKRTIATYMHAVACYLNEYATYHDPEETGRLGHERWLHEIASVLALKGADCECGKPAFLHRRCRDLSSVSDTAFHVVLLKQHTKLETKMLLEEGKGIHSVCPYLKVSRKDPLFTRRNALEWACARGLESSVVRLVAMTEAQGRNAENHLPMATAVCAMHTQNSKGILLRFLLDKIERVVGNPGFRYERLQYHNSVLSLQKWALKVVTQLAQHKRRAGIDIVRKRFPCLNNLSVSAIVPEFSAASIRIFMEAERPFCNFMWDDDENQKHWKSCCKDWCCNLYSKAGPWSVAYRVRYCLHRMGNRECGRHIHPPDNGLYDVNGWAKEL